MSDDEAALREELRELRESVSGLERRVSELETTVEETSSGDTAAETGAETAESAASDPHLSETEPASGTTTRGRISSISLPDIEFAVGIKALGLAGGAALIFATLFFVQLAIERGYLGPLGRVVLGTGVGLGMFGGGRYVAERRGLPQWGKLVSGTGFVIAYLAVYAMTGFESYREAIGAPVWVSLAGIALLVVGVVADSVRRRDVVVAGGAVVFGYLAVLLTLGEVAVTVSAGYIVGLTIVLVGSALVHPWKLVLAAGVSAGYLSVFGWIIAGSVDFSWLAVGVSAAVFGLFLVGVELLRRDDPPAGEPSPAVGLTGVVSAINGVCGMVFLGTSTGGLYESRTAAAVAVLAVGVALFGVYLGTTEVRDRSAPAEPFLAFLALGVAVGLVGDDVTRVLTLAIGATIAIVSAPRLAGRWLRVAGHTVAALLFLDALRVVYVGGSIEYLPVAATTAEAGMYAVLVVCYYGLFVLERRWNAFEGEVPVLSHRVSVLYGWFGSVLLALFFEIVFDGVALSAAWALLGFVVIAAGTVADVRRFRLQGMSLLGITTLKVFVVDTADLDPVSRILSFVVLGVVLLATSYFYARTQAAFDLPELGRDRD